MTLPQQPALFVEPDAAGSGPVECLGLTFENDTARQAYFIEKLREKLQDPEFHRIEGFPIGTDEDVLLLSDPPYYTACPNPFLRDFIARCGKPYRPDSDDYRREPFAVDVSEGKSDPIYLAHSYHTKVPHKAIMRYILHYTEPGDVIFDGFCGTGMSGVAAQLCGDKKAIESLGYLVKEDGSILNRQRETISRLGARRAVLNDLSPAAAFIAYNYNVPVDTKAFELAARQLLAKFEAAYGWMYQTKHNVGNIMGRINYTVWSDVFRCNHCQGEIVFWTEAVKDGEVKDEIICPHCGAVVDKLSLDRATITTFDATLGQLVTKAKRIPVLINYSANNIRYEKEPDEADLALLTRLENEPIPGWYPTRRIDQDIDLWYERDYRSLGIYSVDAFFYRRSLIMVSFFREEIRKTSGRLRGFLWFWFQSVLMGFSLLNRYRAKGYSQVNQILSGTLYVGAILAEISPWYALDGKIGRLREFNYLREPNAFISTGSTGMVGLPDNSIDYIFTDPPFGSNIIYSDLSYIWEAWLGLSTNTQAEAVVHRRKRENAFALEDYTWLMTRCFTEMYRVLKPGRWITVEFHNSKNNIWTAIQEAMLRAGFMIADVRTLDKQTQTFKQVTTAGAVKQDLVISAYKPNGGLEQRFKLEAGSEAGAWDFVRTHLRQLPVFVETIEGRAELISERMNYLLFDRMVAFHVQRGLTVPLSAAEFYAGLEQRFPKRDDMYFLPDQVAMYDQKRLQAVGIEQLQLFVTDEYSAIQWLRQALYGHPQTFQEIHPQFLRILNAWAKNEKPLELTEILEQNFLRYSGHGPIPDQIWNWLRLDPDYGRQMTGHSPDNPPFSLQLAAKHRWYVPDPTRAADLEKLRERELLKEFEEYRQSKQKKLKVFRLEAVRAGFKKAWQDQQYRTIIEVAEKIPDAVLQEDSKLLMWYDQAVTRLER